MIKRHSAFIRRSLRRFGVPEELTDDAAQLVLLTLSNRIRDVDPERARAFLFGTCVRVAANVKRGLSRRREVSFEGFEFKDPSEDPERLLDHKQRREALAFALASVPSHECVVFVRYELEGQTLVEIAKSLRVPVGTATSRLRRARERMATLAVSARVEAGSPQRPATSRERARARHGADSVLRMIL